jgi:hypothetical protein
MSAAVMSNNNSMKWEQVGSKKRPSPTKPTNGLAANGRQSSIPTLQTKTKSKDSRMPTIVSLRMCYIFQN